MTDEQFDDLARKALAFDAGPTSQSSWHRVQPVRWAWLPTLREIMICGCVGAAALTLVSVRINHGAPSPPKPNAVVQAALPTQRRSLLAEVTRIDGTDERSAGFVPKLRRIATSPN